MSILKNISIKNKLYLLILPLIFLILLLSFSFVYFFYSKYDNNVIVKHDVVFSKKILAILNNLQEERDKSAYYLTTDSKKYKNELESLRLNTDKLVAELVEIFKTFDKKEYNATKCQDTIK